MNSTQVSIDVQNVSRLYGTQKALDNISYSVQEGEIVGFIGPNGAGKSTMMKILCGYLPQSSGKVSVLGLDNLTDAHELRKHIGYLPENNPLYPEMFVKEYLSFVGNIYGKEFGTDERVDELIKITGLTPEKHKRIGQLSKGYRQRVGLAQAMIHNPGVLILDEPTTGLDPNQIIEIRNLIRESGQEKTVFLSTHIMQEVEAICDRVIILREGRIVANDATGKIRQSQNKGEVTVIVTFDRDPGEELIKKLTGVTGFKNTGSQRWIIQSTSEFDVRPDIFKLAVDNSLTVLEMVRESRTLEQVFQELTKK